MKKIRFLELILLINLVISIPLLVIYSKTIKQTRHEMYDVMVEAQTKALECFKKTKEKKLELGLSIPEYDILETGLIGTKKRTSITTTEGVLEAKRTTTNPLFASLIVRLLTEAGIKKGDEVGFMFSSSFPAMNINVMSACYALDLKVLGMASIGASYYGANEVDFTFYDIWYNLYSSNVLPIEIKYWSLGGDEDLGLDFRNELEKGNIIARIKSHSNFISIDNFQDNINQRIELYNQSLPNMKMFINVGGTLVSFGKGLKSFSSPGIFKNNNEAKVNKNIDEKYGLLQRFVLNDCMIFNIINIKQLSSKYQIPFDSTSYHYESYDEFGKGLVFYKNKYLNFIPIIILGLNTISIGVIIIYRKNKKEIENRNYILKEV